MHLSMINPTTGVQKFIKVGFSWTLFLFTPFYGIPLFVRGLYPHGAAIAVVATIAVLARDQGLVTLVGAVLLGSMFFYGFRGNELTLNHLRSKGWVNADGSAPPMQTIAQPVAPSTASANTIQSVGSSKIWKGLGIAGAVVIGLVVIGAIVGPPNDNAGSTVDEASGDSTDGQALALQVTAAELYRAYEANEQAAQMNYGGKPLEVGGYVSSIELDMADERMVNLTAGEFLEEVTLHFTSDFANETSQLRKGEWFNARCESLTEIMGAPQLSDCVPVWDE